MRSRKKYLPAFFFGWFVVWCLLANPAPALAQRSLKVGAYNFKPLIFVDEYDIPRGLFVDVLTEIAHQENWQLTWVTGSWNEIYNKLATGEIDLLPCVGQTRERVQQFDFSRESLVTDWGVVFRRRGTNLSSVFDLNGQRIAVVKGGVYSTELRQFLMQFDLHPEWVEKNDYSEVFDALANGDCAAGVCANISGKSFEQQFPVERTPIVFSPIHISYAAMKGKSQDVLVALDRHIAAMKNNSTAFLNGRYQQWMGVPVAPDKKTSGLLILLVLSVIALLVIVLLLARRVHVRVLELSRQRRMLHSLINATTDAVFIKDTAGRYQLVNREIERLFNRPRAEIIDRDDTHFFTAEDAARIMAADRDILAKDTVGVCEGIYNMIDGECFRQATKGPLRDENGTVVGVFGISRDITSQRQIEQALAESHERLNFALLAARMGTWSVDLASRKRVFDTQTCYLFGIDSLTFTGTAEEFYRVLHPDDLEKQKRALTRTIETGEPYELEYRVIWPDGTIRHLATRGRLSRGEQGEPLRVDGVLWDITEQNQQQIKTLQASKMVSLGEMASGMAHEINNPINGVINCAQLLQSRMQLDEPNREILARIVREGQRISRIVRSLLSVAHPGWQRQESMQVDDLVDGVLALCEGQLAKDGIELQKRIPADLAPVPGERQQLEQVLLNLINNSRHALNERFPDGHPEKQLVIGAWHLDGGAGNRLCLEIHDRGIGIPDELLPRIFDPFFTTKPAGVGTGLGLGLCYEIIRRHDGEIRVESEFGSFTRVTVELPLVSSP